MNSPADKTNAERPLWLNLFCDPVADGNWRVHATPARMPRHLRACFDEAWEAFPVLLDFEDLESTIREKELQIEMRWSALGGVELTGHGRSAEELGIWLTRMLASGVRQVASSPTTNTMKESAG